MRPLDERATKIARARQERGITAIRAAFGVLVETDGEHVLAPSPAVFQVVLDGARRQARPAPAKGVRALRRRAKRRRYAANTIRGERNGWRAYGEEEKRRAKAAS